MDNKLCWICNSEKTKLLWPSSIDRQLNSNDVLITDKRYGETLALNLCLNCGFVFANTIRNDNGSLIALYENMNDQTYLDTIKAREFEMQKILRIALTHLPKAQTILDIGAGVGLLVKAAQDMDIKATGVEPSKSFVQKAKNLFEISLIEGTVPNASLSNDEFDIIFAIDVIEHVTNPVHFLETIRDHLANEGIAVISTPDRGSLIPRILRRKWWHYRLAHIGYFDRHSFRIAAKKAGFNILRYHTQTWYLPFGYLLERAFTYIKLKRLNKFLKDSEFLSRITIPINLHDHLVAILSKSKKVNNV